MKLEIIIIILIKLKILKIVETRKFRYFFAESGYCAQEKKIYLPEYHRLRAVVTWKYLVGIYQLRAGNIFLSIFQRLRTLYYTVWLSIRIEYVSNI
ncbi:hypothetical protein C0J52_15910 [Blattella germanica]|nr:hypothetical protein C0J52_15910 [Blattella germanica]